VRTRFLALFFRALETASNIKGLIGGMVIQGIEVHLRLGLFFKIKVRFIPAAEPATTAPGALIHEPAEPIEPAA